MTTFDVALVREQGVEFAVLSVRDSVLDNRSEAEKLIAQGYMMFRRPTVLMGSHHHRLLGRADIVRFLGHVDPSQLPWRHATM